VTYTGDRSVTFLNTSVDSFFALILAVWLSGNTLLDLGPG